MVFEINNAQCPVFLCNCLACLRLVLSHLEKVFNVLLKDIESDELCSLVSTNPFINAEYSISVAETVTLFCVCALTEIGNAKGNLIGVFVMFLDLFNYIVRMLTAELRC